MVEKIEFKVEDYEKKERYVYISRKLLLRSVWLNFLQGVIIGGLIVYFLF